MADLRYLPICEPCIHGEGSECHTPECALFMRDVPEDGLIEAYAVTRAEEGLHFTRGDWMQTYTGRRFYPLDPQPEDVDPADIAHALSMVCRYGGHVHRFYSVAEHCVHLSHAVAPEHALWALLHDATEAYVGDMVRPLKRHIGQYQLIEARLRFIIAERFALPPRSGLMKGQMPDEVKDADNRILLDERAALMPNTAHSWGVDHLDPLGIDIWGWHPEQAERRYAERLRDLLEQP